MFQSISWNDFLTIAIIGLIVYYGISSLILYSEEIKSLLRNGFRRPVRAGESSVDDARDVMGKARTNRSDEENQESQSISELLLAPGQPEEGSYTQDPNNALIGSVADLGEEIKTAATKLSGVDKSLVAGQFKAVLNKYAQLGATSYRSTINLLLLETIKEHTSHEFSVKDINAWWTTADK